MSFDVDRVSEEMKLNVRQMFQVQQRRGGSRHKPARKLVRFRVSSELSLILCLKKNQISLNLLPGPGLAAVPLPRGGWGSVLVKSR